MLLETDLSEQECEGVKTEASKHLEGHPYRDEKRGGVDSKRKVKWFGWRPTSPSYWGYLVYMAATIAFFFGSVFSIVFCKEALDPHCASAAKVVLVDWAYFFGGVCFFVGAILFYFALISSESTSIDPGKRNQFRRFFVWRPRCPIFQSWLAAFIAGSLYLTSVILSRIEYFSPLHYRRNSLGPSMLFIIGTGFLLTACLITAVKLWLGKNKYLDLRELAHWTILLRVLGTLLFLGGGLSIFWPEGDIFSLVMIKIPFLVGSLLFCSGVYLALFWTLNHQPEQ